MVKLLLSYFLAHSWNLCDQDISAVRLFRSPWHVYPSSSVLLSSHGSSEQIRCSSYSSLWKRLYSSTTASGMCRMLVVMEGGGCSMERLTDMDEVLLQSVQAIHRRLNNSGRSTLRVLPSGGTTEGIRYHHSRSMVCLV